MIALLHRLLEQAARREAAAESIGHAETAALARQDAADIREAVGLLSKGTPS